MNNDTQTMYNMTIVPIGRTAGVLTVMGDIKNTLNLLYE